MTVMLSWWECQWKIGVSCMWELHQGRLRGSHLQELTSGVNLPQELTSGYKERAPCSLCHRRWNCCLNVALRRKKRFLCDPLPSPFNVLSSVWDNPEDAPDMKIKSKWDFSPCRAFPTGLELLSAGWGCNSWAFPAGARCRNSHFLWQISSGASITKPWLDQMTPREISDGEKARAGTLQSWNVLSPQWRAFIPRDPVKGTSSLMKLNNLDFNTQQQPLPGCLITVWSFPINLLLCSWILTFLRLKQRYLYLLKPFAFVFRVSAFIHFVLFPRQDFHWLTPWGIQDEPEPVPVKSRAENSSASVAGLFYGNQVSNQDPFVLTLWELV